MYLSQIFSLTRFIWNWKSSDLENYVQKRSLWSKNSIMFLESKYKDYLSMFYTSSAHIDLFVTERALTFKTMCRNIHNSIMFLASKYKDCSVDLWHILQHTRYIFDWRSWKISSEISTFTLSNHNSLTLLTWSIKDALCTFQIQLYIMIRIQQ